MLNRNVNRKVTKCTEKLVGWDWAIQDAKMRIKRMRQSIRTFQRMRDAGEPWHENAPVENQQH
jgi:hypothetical protein